jgi:hypothetical protein
MVFTRWQWYYNKTQHTKIHTSQNNTQHTTLKQNTGHKATKTIKVKLHSMNDHR